MGYEHRARGVAGDDPRGRHHPIRLPRVAGRCLLGRMLAGSHSLRAGIPAPRALIAPASSLRAPPCAHGRVRRQESPGLAVSGAARRVRSELARSDGANVAEGDGERSDEGTRFRPQLRTFLGRAGRLRCVEAPGVPGATTRPHPRPEPRSRARWPVPGRSAGVLPTSRRCPGRPRCKTNNDTLSVRLERHRPLSVIGFVGRRARSLPAP